MNRYAAPPKKIVMMEDHDGAYHAWREHGVTARTLVHIDAHIDFGWIPDMDMDEIRTAPDTLPEGGLLLNPFIRSRKNMVDIGNYICPAMREGIVNKFYWVVPDESWQSPRGIRRIKKYLGHILRIKRYSGGALELHRDHMRCRAFDKEIIVCGLNGLTQIDEPVLLDIDVDFLLTPLIWDDLDPTRTPWIFPEELFKKVTGKISDIDVLTIAYSLEGGFTPLRFKYLGDELRSLFAGDLTEGARKAMGYKKEASLLERKKRYKESKALYEDVLQADGQDASTYFNLSFLHLEGPEKDTEKARHLYHQAIAKDKSYATIYNNYGILSLRRNKLKRVEEEYKKLLLLNEESAGALSGMGYIALKRRRFAQAGKYFERSIVIQGGHPEPIIGKGIASFKTGNMEEAKALFLSLEKILPDSAEACWWLGRIAEKSGETAEAIDNYKRAAMRGGEGPVVHLRLLRLYIITGNFYRAREELNRFFRMMANG